MSDREKTFKDERPRSPISGTPVPNGRPKGVQNKVTTKAKELVVGLVENNLTAVQAMLQQVASGIKQNEADPNSKYIVDPDPKGAIGLIFQLLEYHIPKLARQEIVGDAQNPLMIQRIDTSILTDDQLKAVHAAFKLHSPRPDSD